MRRYLERLKVRRLCAAGGAFSTGGSSSTAKFFGVDNTKGQEWGQYDGGYSTFGVSYGLSKPGFGSSMTRTNTKFFKPDKK